MKLIIVESPTKAKTISRFLGANSGCRVIASNGHIRAIPKTDLCIDVNNGYKPKYVVAPGKEKILAQIKKELKSADELILATDEDREGESISWHLLDLLKPQIPYRRMVFHEITKKAITEALENGRDIDMNLVHAQEARRVLDRLYGYTISPVLWSKLSNKNLSAGRVQSPGLRLIVDREMQRLKFRKSSFFGVSASFKEGFSATLKSFDGKRVAVGSDFDSSTGEFKKNRSVILLDSEEACRIRDVLSDAEYSVMSVEEEEKLVHPAAPFTTSTLQQEANRKLRMSAKDTMKIAQSLYENGFITYMRTDSTNLSEEGIKAARNSAAMLFGQENIPSSPQRYKTKDSLAQEAHEAIRPAGEEFVRPQNSGLRDREFELYNLIWKRTVASQMKSAVKTNTSVSIIADRHDAVFCASGSRVKFPGFLSVYVEGSDDADDAFSDGETVLPGLEKGQKLSAVKVEEVAHETREPGRFTEATLVKELESLGIGRPSTYASIIDKMFEKNYAVQDKRALIPTFTGIGVVNLLEKYFSDRIDYGFTKDMEDKLDKVAEGSTDELQFLKDFYEGSRGLKNQVADGKDLIDSKAVKVLELPQLRKENSITLGPYGPYVKTEDGKFVSVPSDWTPSSVTDDMVSALRNESSGESGGKNGPAVIGTSPDGRCIRYCTGKYGDYWQLGETSDADVKKVTVPKSLIGVNVSAEHVMDYFNLPRIIGTLESGEQITGSIGRYGAYLKAGDEYRNLRDPEQLFSVGETEARLLFSVPKLSGKGRRNSDSSRVSAQSAIKDFGDYNGQNLSIRHGRYGFYIKYGDRNVAIDKMYKNDEEACKAMPLEKAVEYIVKKE